MERVVITDMCYRGTKCRVMAWQENGKICRIKLEDPHSEKLLGSIHVGKVQKVLPDIKGAFVEIEGRQSCYFPYSKELNPIYTIPKKKNGLKAGDELLVQVTKEAIKTKAPCVSSNLSFTGNFLVLTTGNRTIGISSKIDPDKREEYKALLNEILDEDRMYGVILRTNGMHASKEALTEELRILEQRLQKVIEKGMYTPCHTKVWKGESAVESVWKEIYWENTDKIITDQEDIYQELKAYKAEHAPSQPCQVEWYQDALLPLYRLYNLEQTLDQLMQEKVWLRSGGFLVIQQTEAFVAVDVNSGKHSSKKDAEENYKQINREAAQEIARQIRLRNLSGMILIDFINMKGYEDRSELLQYMKRLVNNDPVRTVVVDVTALGIMEITRKKMEKSLVEQLVQLRTTANSTID